MFGGAAGWLLGAQVQVLFVGAVAAGREGGARAVVGCPAIGLEAKLPYGAGWPIIPVDGGATVIGAG